MPTNNCKVALIQFDIQPGQILHNETIAEKLIGESAANGCDLIVLPELWNTGYDLLHLPRLAQDMRGSSVKLLQKLAKQYKMMIFGGSIAEKKGDNFYNTALVIDQKGEVIHKYRKIHLFPYGLEEEKHFAVGEEWGLVETPWGPIGLIICYDLRFPELARNLVLRGAKAIVVPAQWPAVRVDHWQLLNKARAVENQVFVFANNRTGKDKSGRYPGCSMIIDPWGTVLAGGEEANQAGIILSEVDFTTINDVRSKIPVFDNRRRLLDEIDDSNL